MLWKALIWASNGSKAYLKICYEKLWSILLWEDLNIECDVIAQSLTILIHFFLFG